MGVDDAKVRDGAGVSTALDPGDFLAPAHPRRTREHRARGRPAMIVDRFKNVDGHIAPEQVVVGRCIMIHEVHPFGVKVLGRVYGGDQ